MLVLFLGVSSVYSQEKEEKEKFMKKVNFEFTFGIGRAEPSGLYERNRGIDSVISQYATFYNLTHTSTGGLKENKLFIPFSLVGTYSLNEKIFLRAGIDFAFNSGSSSKAFTVAWNDFNEEHDYGFSDKVSYVMPHIGAGYKTKKFDIYGGLGIGMASYTHDETQDYSEPGFSYDVEQSFKGSGSGIGVILGVKYNAYTLKQRSGKRPINLIAKAEILILKINTLKGDKSRVITDNQGNRSSDSVSDGTFYSYQWTPYGSTSIDYWDVFAGVPNDSSINDLSKLALNLSGFRVMIGISF